MKKEAVIYGVIGLLVGGVLVGFTANYAVNNNNQSMMNMMGMRGQEAHEGMSMDDMTGSLRGKTGDDFDKAFIDGMIAHHQGAIDMAKLAKENAKHDEVKKMADDIISAQSKEIDMMQTWQTDWGYKNAPQSQDMMNH